MTDIHTGRLLAAVVRCSALLLPACTMETPTEVVEAPAAERAEELDLSWTDVSQSWNQGDPPEGKVLAPELTHVCVLTRVKGRFNGYGEKLYLTIEPRNGVQSWVLRGESQSTGVGGSAKCFRKDGFIANGGNRWNSPEWRIRRGGGCGSASVPTTSWSGHATTFLSGLSGKFEGGAERVRIAQSTSLSQPSLAIAEGCQGAMEVKARAFFAGDTATSPAIYLGPVFQVTAQSGSVAGSSKEVLMAPSDKAMCHLVWIGGDFGGGAESVEILEQISPDDLKKYWYLKVTAGPRDAVDPGRYIEGRARCYARDQSH